MYTAAMADNIDSLSNDILQRHYPLHWACFHGNEAYLKELLMSENADVYQEDGLHGWTPMHWAAFQGKWKCLELIRQICPVDLDVTNTRLNQTPAHIAAQKSQAECIAWLVQQGISLGIQDHMGDTPLHKAAQSGQLECVRLLISHGPILTTFNLNGQTPLDVAAQSGHMECKAFLEQAMSSQHSSFFPSASSPILMNGEGIYQNGVIGRKEEECDCDQDMEMGNDGDAAATAVLFQPTGGCKRSFDHEDEMPVKRQRLFAPSSADKRGTVNNNIVLSSYQGILAMSVEPLRNPSAHHVSDMQEVHVMPSPNVPVWTPSKVSINDSSSIEDHCSALCAQSNYDEVIFKALIHENHGF